MKKTYLLQGLDCANCAAEIENNVSKMKGVSHVSVSFLTTKMVLETEEDMTDEFLKKLTKTVKKTEPDVIMKGKKKNG